MRLCVAPRAARVCQRRIAGAMRGLGVLPALLAAATAGSRHGLLGAPRAGINMAASDMLIVGTMDGEVHAVSGASGELLWSMSTGGRIISSSRLAMLEAAAAQQQKLGGGAAAGSDGDLRAPNQSGQYDRHGAEDEACSLGAGVSDDASRQRPALPPLPSPTFASAPTAPPTGPPASRPPPAAECDSRAVAPELLPPPPPRAPRADAPVMVAPPTVDASAGEGSGVGFGGRAPPPPPSPPPLPRRRSLLPPEKLRSEFRAWADRPPRNEHEHGERQRHHQYQDQQQALEEAAEAAEAAEAEAAAAAAVGLEMDELLVVPGLDGSLFVLGEEGEAHPLTDYTVQVSARPGRGDPVWGSRGGGLALVRGALRTCGLPPRPDSPPSSFACSAVPGRIWSLSPPSSPRACS